MTEVNFSTPPDGEKEQYEWVVQGIKHMFASAGRDFGKESQEWARRYLKSICGDQSRLELEELVQAGCDWFALAVSLKMGVYLSTVPDRFRQMISPDQLREAIASFEKTALLLEHVSQSLKVDDYWLAQVSGPSPSETAARLRLYASMLAIGPTLIDVAQIKSVKDIERYLPTAYVKHATGTWHDREVSALIGAAIGTEIEEGTHRVWRYRNFDHLRLPFEPLYLLAEAASEVHYRDDKNPV
jgi:hypothetical protein